MYVFLITCHSRLVGLLSTFDFRLSILEGSDYEWVFEVLHDLQVPELRLFENRAMKHEFEKLTTRLRCMTID